MFIYGQAVLACINYILSILFCFGFFWVSGYKCRKQNWGSINKILYFFRPRIGMFATDLWVVLRSVRYFENLIP